MDDLLQQGITAYKAGKRDEARKFFIAFIKQNPESERGWGWMYDISGEDKERIYCLKQMLRINPKNEKANQLLNKLLTPPPTLISPLPTQASLPSKNIDNVQIKSNKSAVKKKNGSIDIVIMVILGFSLLCLFVVVAQSGVLNKLSPIPTTDPEIEKARWGTIDIREFTKNPKNYNKQELHYIGSVFSIQEDSGGALIQVEINVPGDDEFNFNSKIVIVNYKGATTNIYENTSIEFWGYGDGVQEFENLLGIKITQPVIKAKYLTLLTK